MKLIIDIHEKDYQSILNSGQVPYGVVYAIMNGIPLPKGHGDLIDRSTLEPDTEWSEWYDDWVSYSYGQIADADVVIKADGGEENGE